MLAAPVGAQPSILSIAVPVALARLGSSDLQISTIAPQFLQTASDTLGNFGDGTDGFDAIMAVPFGSFDGDVNAIGELDQHLLAADFIEGEIDAATLAPVGNDLIAFTDTGDTILNAFDVAVTPAGDPNPQPPPDPNPQPTPHPRVGGNPGIGGNPQPVGTGGGGTHCIVASNPINGEFIGVICDDVSPGGPGIHSPEQA